MNYLLLSGGVFLNMAQVARVIVVSTSPLTVQVNSAVENETYTGADAQTIYDFINRNYSV